MGGIRFFQTAQIGRSTLRTYRNLSIWLSAVLIFTSISVFTPATAAPPASCDGSSTQNTLKVTALHGQVVYVDTGTRPRLDAAYVSYKVTNTNSSAREHIWVELSGFTGNSVKLANPLDSTVLIDSIAGSGSQTTYFLLQATTPTTTDQVHTVKIYDSRPDLGGNVLYTCNYTFTDVKDTIKAKSNKVISISASNTDPVLGELLTFTTIGKTGQIGQGESPDGDIMWFSPSAYASWPTRALRLESISVLLDSDGNFATTNDQGTYTDQLIITDVRSITLGAPSNKIDSSSKYRAQYNFRVIGSAPNGTKVVPIAQISSGARIKHTDTLSTESGPFPELTFDKVDTTININKSATLIDPEAPVGYSTIKYTLEITTNNTDELLIDQIVDDADTGIDVVEGTIKFSDSRNTTMTTTGNPGVDLDGNNVFIGPFYVKASNGAQIEYLAYIPRPVTETIYRNYAYGYIGDRLVGKSDAAIDGIKVTSGPDGPVINDDERLVGPTISTVTAADVTTTTATLNALIDPNGNYTAFGFQYSTSSSLASPTCIQTVGAGSQSNSLDEQAYSYNVTGLAANTTYYFRAVGNSDPSVSLSDACTTPDLLGEIFNFTTTPQGLLSQTITWSTVFSNLTTETPLALTTATTASSGLPVTLTPTNSAVCEITEQPDPDNATAGYALITVVGPGTCEITASQTGNASYAAATSVVKSFTVSGVNLSLTIVGSGTVTSDVGNVSCSTTCTKAIRTDTAIVLTATPATGFVFSGWSGACSGSDTCSLTMNAAKSVTATFIAAPYTVSLTVTGNGSVSNSLTVDVCNNSCSIGVVHGDTITLTPSSGRGWEFVSWSGACSGSSNCVLGITGNTSVGATFSKRSARVDVTTQGQGKVANDYGNPDCRGNCSINAHELDVITLQATADVGWEFTGWTGACSGTSTTCVINLDPPESSSLSISSASVNQIIKSTEATFQITQETLSTTIVGNGTIDDGGTLTCSVSCTQDYDYNTSVTLTATADVGWEFTGWSGACSGTTTCTLTMTADKSVSATFTQITHTLSITIIGSGTVDDGGSLSCSGDCSEIYNEGDIVTLSASPDPSYFFGGWSGDCIGMNDCTITITADTYVTAEFTLVPVITNDLTMNILGNGSIDGDLHCSTATCAETLNESTTLTLSATPDTGWEFIGWSGDCTGTGNCTLSMDLDRSITAEFSQITHDLEITVSGSGTVTDGGVINCVGLCSHTFNEGDVVLLNATADPGWEFTGWSGACSGSLSCSVTMNSAKSVTATFIEIHHDLAMNILGNGSISGDYTCASSSCSESILENTSVSLTATADPGWYFVGWSGDCVGDNPCLVLMDSAKTATATFERITFTLSITIIGNGTVDDGSSISCSSTCDETINENETLTLTATPDTGWEFTGWSGACTGNSSCTVTMSEAKSVTATFTQITHTLDIVISGDGHIGDESVIDCAANCSEIFNYGDSITLTATPSVGFYFAGWTGDCTGTGSCTVIMNGNKTVTATFLLIPIITHDLTLTVVGGGTISDGESIDCATNCLETFVEDTEVTLTATAASGWEFTGWTGACSGTGTCTITMDGDKSVTASFSIITIDLEMIVVGNGDIGGDYICTSGTCTEVVSENEVVSLSATAASGWEFTGWTGACSGTGTCTITMDGDKSVTATFIQIVHNLSITISGNGSVIDSGSINCQDSCVEIIADGTEVTLTAQSDTNWYFVGWSGDCSGTSTCTVLMNSDKSVSAEFLLIPVTTSTLSVEVVGKGTVRDKSPMSALDDENLVNCSGTCTYAIPNGSTIVLRATAPTGWEFEGWSGDCSGTAPCTLSMTSNKNVIATFIQIEPVTLTITVIGSGTVTGNNISCQNQCEYELEPDTIINLTGTAGTEWEFEGWSGDCSGTAPCSLQMTTSQAVTATFTPITVVNPHSLTIKVIGMGQVKVDGNKICTDECTYLIDPDVNVSLDSITSNGWQFSHWSAACQSEDCTLSLTSDLVLSVYFAPPPPSATYSPTLRSTKISWSEVPAPEGVSLLYSVLSKGQTLCTTTETSCVVSKVLGPKHNLTIQSQMFDLESLEGPVKLKKGKLLITIRFDFDKSIVKNRYKHKLKIIAKSFAQAGFTKYEIRGHTDSRGSNPYNKLLSQFRALNVIREMRKFAKLSYKTTWYGERKPIATNKTKTGRKENRRTEVRIVL